MSTASITKGTRWRVSRPLYCALGNEKANCAAPTDDHCATLSTRTDHERRVTGVTGGLLEPLRVDGVVQVWVNQPDAEPDSVPRRELDGDQGEPPLRVH